MEIFPSEYQSIELSRYEKMFVRHAISADGYGFLLLKPEFTTRELYSSVRRMEVSVWIMAILGAASLLVSLYFLFFQISYQSLWLELLFLFCGAASTALSLVLVRLQKQYEYAMVRDEGAGELDDEDDDPL